MATIYQFPEISFKDKELVHNIIISYTKGKCDRNTMMRQIAFILEQKKIKKMPVFGYTVKLLQYYKGLPIIHIEGNTISEHCLCCGSTLDQARYLMTNKENLVGTYDVISVTCLKCGCVYATKAKNGRRAWKDG